MENPTLRPKRDRRAQPRIPPRDITCRTPEDGDIVVREEKRDGTLVFVLHTAPGTDQHLLRSRGEAIAEALASAGRQHVRAWLTDEGCDFTLLEDFRGGTTIEDVLSHLRAEFLEMPGLRLNSEQVQRLCGVEQALCQTALEALVDAKFLSAKPNGYYARLMGETIQRQQPAKADLRTDTRFSKAS
jgi:hypothetical protein